MGCSVRRRIAHSFHLVSPCTVYTLSVSTFWSLGVLPMFVDFESISKKYIYIYTLIRQSVQRKVSRCLILAHDVGWLCEEFSATPVVVSPKNDQNIFQNTSVFFWGLCDRFAPHGLSCVAWVAQFGVGLPTVSISSRHAQFTLCQCLLSGLSVYYLCLLILILSARAI